MQEQLPFDVLFDQTRGLQTSVSDKLADPSNEDLRIRADNNNPWFLRDDHGHGHGHDKDHDTGRRIDKGKDKDKDKGKPKTPPKTPKRPIR